MRRNAVLVSFLLFGFVVTSFASAAALRTVALTDTFAPGTGASFLSIPGGPVLNDLGEVGFVASVAGDGLGDGFDTGIWSEGGNTGLQLVVREGFPALGNPSAVFGDFFESNAGRFSEAFQINNSGDIALIAELVDKSQFAVPNKSAILVSRGGTGLKLLAREGDIAPGANARFSIISDGPRIDEAGRTAFRAFISVDGEIGASDQSIWRERNGGLQLVARSGSDAPMTDSTFGAFFDPLINPSGQTAFHSLLFSPGESGAGSGNWVQSPNGTLQLIARNGQSAPDTNSEFATLGNPAFNDSGQTAFSGTLAGSEVTPENRWGVWKQGGDGNLHMVVRSGDVAPGTDVAFLGFQNPVFNARGEVAFRSSLVGTEVTDGNRDGIWSDAGDSGLQLIARAGNNAPGTESQFGDFLWTGPVLNGNGQIAFFALLTDGEKSAGSGIWATDSEGIVRLIATTGGQIDVDNGPLVDLRTISSVSFNRPSGNEDGGPSAFNERGELAFIAHFTDGSSGVFVSRIVAVPEPTTALLLTTCLLSALLHLRNRTIAC